MAERARLTPPELRRREAARRRAILLGLALLLVLSMSPVFGHHLPIGLDHAMSGRDHVWAFCMMALRAVLAPVHGVFHLLFFAGLGWAILDRARAWRAAHRVLRALPAARPRPGAAFHAAASEAGVDPALVSVVAGLPTPAFTAGLLRPRVYVAAELTGRLDRAELAAVLAHEAEHVRRCDPLRLFLLRFLGCLLFWLPAVRGVADDYAAENEVLADDAAARRHGLALASALVRLADWPVPAPLRAGAGFTGGGLLERRVRRLTGEPVEPRSRVTGRSLAAAAIALALAWSSGLAVAHPAAHHHDAHCAAHDGAAVLHLFCPLDSAPGSAACPHRGRE
jgi:hypothetical protein